ncbi:MAG TPA: bacillithiol biosynthesis BshC, partial [Bacillota bacterium]
VAQRLWSLRMGAGAFLSGKAQAELKARLRELDTVGIEEQFSRLEQRLREAYGEAMAALRGISPHLERIGQANLERVLAQVRYFQGKAQAHHRRAHRQLLDAFTYAEAALRPRGQLQERIYSTLPVVAEFGDALIRSLLRPIPMAPHHLVIMEAEANLEATAPPVPQRLDGQVCR